MCRCCVANGGQPPGEAENHPVRCYSICPVMVRVDSWVVCSFFLQAGATAHVGRAVQGRVAESGADVERGRLQGFHAREWD
jgi:hypothetical protein